MYPFKLYNHHLSFVVSLVDLLSCSHLQPPSLCPVCLYVCLLSVTPPWTTLSPEKQRGLKVRLRSVRSEVYWYPTTKTPYQYQCISVWPCAVSSASISSAWVGHLWFSPLQTLPSQHSEKQHGVTAFHNSTHTQTSAHTFSGPKSIDTLKSHLNIY